MNATPAALPTSSNNTPPITGTWSPAVINTSVPGSRSIHHTGGRSMCAPSTTMTVVVTNSITPTFTQLGPYCVNATPAALPTSSNNTPPITGTWSPAVINTSVPGSQVYTFTPTAGQCAAPSTTMTVVVTNSITPTFTQLGPYCVNATPAALPTSSNNTPPITGTWSPAVINTSVPGSQVYTFTPAAGQCAATSNMAITILSTPSAGSFEVTNTSCNLSNGAVTFNLVSSGTPPYSYNFNNQGFTNTTTFNNLFEGSYPVVVKDANDCILNIIVIIGNDPSVPWGKSGWVANIFSPNGDGVNDELKIFIGTDIKRVNKFEIYDRWGSKLFAATNIDSK